jgi:dTDP-4-dehydrorhamnose reductase
MNLIIGGSGTLGNYLKLVHENLNIKFMSPSSKELDITSLSSCKMYFQNHSNIKKVYFLAAMTDVDECEKNPKLAYKINVQGLRNFLDLISPDMRFIYISTSAVFGGSSQKYNYSEMDNAVALNTYGMSKLMAEKYVKKHLKNFLIIRSSWMIGGGPERDKKFISKILPLLIKDQNISVVNDKFGSLTYAKHLAEFLTSDEIALYSDILHFSSKDYVSRYEIANYIAELVNSKSQIFGVSSNFFPLPAPRPISEGLTSVTDINYYVDWKNIVKDYLQEWI